MVGERDWGGWVSGKMVVEWWEKMWVGCASSGIEKGDGVCGG